MYMYIYTLLYTLLCISVSLTITGCSYLALPVSWLDHHLGRHAQESAETILPSFTPPALKEIMTCHYSATQACK